jgi:hypothetical protein
VRALVENLGAPVQDVIAEFFLKRYGDPQSSDATSEGILDLIRLHAEELGPEKVRRLLQKAVKRGSAIVRRATYRVGAECLGPSFARPALRDPARLVRDWAVQALSKEKLRPGPKSRFHTARRTGASPVD